MKKQILLIPDAPNWAFDHISSAIIKYNPFPNQLEYTKRYITENPFSNSSHFDLIYIFFEAEVVPIDKRIVKGCYSQIWREYAKFTPEYLGKIFSSGSGVVFANDILKEKIVPFLDDSVNYTVIHDSTDHEKFYPLENRKKHKDFTAIFVGKTQRKVKRYWEIIDICKQAGVKLITCENIPHKDLIEYYHSAHVCINFSEQEGGPQTFLEAALCELPMLICSDNALAEKIPCFTAITKTGMIERLKFLKDNPEIALKVGKDARQVVLAEFTYKKTARKFAKFFKQIINNEN